MIKKYSQWITTIIKECNSDLTNKCTEITKRMVKEFPELRRVRGHVIYLGFINNGIGDTIGQQHWWCELEGDIIDPTIIQFKVPQDSIEYIPWKGNTPVGKCMNCGEVSFYHPNCCSEECFKGLNLYLNNKEN